MSFEHLKPKVKVVAEKYGADFVVLFGSRARGTNRPNSDVDLAYGRSEPLALDQELRFGLELAALFGTDHYDIAYIPRASAILLYEITKDAVLLFTNDRLRLPSLAAYADKHLRENMRLYQTQFDRLCAKYHVK